MQHGVRLGVLTDVQYADKEDKVNSRGVTCGYRLTTGKLAEAVAHFNTRLLDGVLHLGDIIDGNCTPEGSLADFNSVMAEFDKLQGTQVVRSGCCARVWL